MVQILAEFEASNLPALGQVATPLAVSVRLRSTNWRQCLSLERNNNRTRWGAGMNVVGYRAGGTGCPVCQGQSPKIGGSWENGRFGSFLPGFIRNSSRERPRFCSLERRLTRYNGFLDPLPFRLPPAVAIPYAIRPAPRLISSDVADAESDAADGEAGAENHVGGERSLRPIGG